MRENLLQFLMAQSASHPDQLLYAFHDRHGHQVESVTCAQFERQTNFQANLLRKLPGIGAGKPVLLSFTPDLSMIRSFFACAKIGAIPVPIPPVSMTAGMPGLERLMKIASDSCSQAVLFNAGQDKAVRQIIRDRHIGQDTDCIRKVLELTWLDTGDMHGELEHFDVTPQEPLFLQYTSGSTSSPRGVMVRHENVIANCPRPAEENCVALSWLPHYHDMGLIGYYLFPLISAGTSHHFSTLNFLRRPVLWFELISRLGVSRTSAPNFAFDYCTKPNRIADQQMDGLDLSSLVDIMNASEPVHPESLRAFKDRFAKYGLRESALTAAYGLAENTLRVTDCGRVTLPVNKEKLAKGAVEPLRGNHRSSKAVTLASSGAPVNGVEIAIVDPKTCTSIPFGRTGEIWVAGTAKADCYWNKPQLSKEQFNAQIAGDERPGGYLRTGDIGFVSEGELFVCGRLSDMIVVRGRNIFPNDIERAICAWFPEIAPGRVAVFGSSRDGIREDGLGIVVEAEQKGEHLALEEVALRVSRAFQLSVLRVTQIRRGSIPKTSSGKISRHQCRTRLEQGDFETIADFRPPQLEGSANSPESFLEMLLARAAPETGDKARISQLGLDSLDLVELASVIHTAALDAGFSDDSLGAATNDLRLLQSATIADIRRLLASLADGSHSRINVASIFEKELASIEGEESARMREDCKLCVGQDYRARQGGVDDGAVFVTGATGFLGSFLVESLLRLDERPIIALVRADNSNHAVNRVKSALIRTGMVSPDKVEEALRSRINVVCGDAEAHRLGLSAQSWNTLAGEVAEILHCAAHVDYVKPYRDLRGPNVLGTAEIVKLCGEGRPKVLNHVSTTFVYGWTPHLDKGENQRNAGMEGLDFGYSQSKWVAEQIVYNAAARGLDIRVFRPALITASKSGCCLLGDIVTRLLSYCIRHGVAPLMKNQLSFLPAEVCANNIVAISRDPGTIGCTFNVTTDQDYTLDTVMRIVSQTHGYPIALVSMEEFIDHIDRYADQRDSLFPLKPFIKNNKTKFRAIEHLRYGNTEYHHFRSRLAEAVDEPELKVVVNSIMNFLIDNQLVLEPA